MKVLCVIFVLEVIAETVEYFVTGPLDMVDIGGLCIGYFSFICLLLGVFMWRRFYRLIPIYLFYTGLRVFIESGYLGEIVVAAIISLNRKSNPVDGKFFESKFYCHKKVCTFSKFAHMMSFFKS